MAKKLNLQPGLLVGSIAGITLEQNVDAIVTVIQSLDSETQLVLSSPDASILEKLKAELQGLEVEVSKA